MKICILHKNGTFIFSICEHLMMALVKKISIFVYHFVLCFLFVNLFLSIVYDQYNR